MSGKGYETYLTPYMNHLNDPVICEKTENESGKDYDIFNGSLICKGAANEIR